ncbi:HNH endonuclease [Methylomonas koyamae]|uniref:HNH endonuclease n=1 Tax=Methylomonas koyamae TaxID=702114 RepID=UPI0012F63AD6|nr:HNH endonuclease [Methylomonas koyamae]
MTKSPSKAVISHQELASKLNVPSRMFTPQASGTPFTGNHLQLETLWSRLIGGSLIYPDDVNVSEHRHVEGAVQQVTVNRYERDPSARRRCIEFHGTSCKACGLNMAYVYGPDLGRDYIHVHHVIPLHTIKDSYVIDPEQDLVPLCPNCHSMVHQRNPPLSVDELRSKIMPRYIALFR